MVGEENGDSRWTTGSMKKGDDWKAYDVVIDGISLVRNYRGQFAAILRASSYEHLVQSPAREDCAVQREDQEC